MNEKIETELKEKVGFPFYYSFFILGTLMVFFPNLIPWATSSNPLDYPKIMIVFWLWNSFIGWLLIFTSLLFFAISLNSTYSFFKSKAKNKE